MVEWAQNKTAVQKGLKNMVLTICIVLYNSNKTDVNETLDSLLSAIKYANLIHSSKLYIVDNSEKISISAEDHPIFSVITYDILYGHGNIGFGAGHNMVLQHQVGKYHLVLNPDVKLSFSSLDFAIKFLNIEKECGLLSPSATYPDGEKQYLCKRYPSLADFLLRGFAPKAIQKLFHKRLTTYEMRKETQEFVFWDPPIVSGCFMFFSGEVFKNLRGFDAKYLLYFEDFDISLRTHPLTRIAYVPSVEIVHKGGNAARKGFWHIQQFIRSAMTFFRSHGFKVL